MFAGENEHDFDAESGDDIMVQGESVMRNEGMWGYDWAIYKDSTKSADADLLRPIFTTDQQDILRNRFDAVEGLSGYKQNDVLRGDNRATAFPSTPDPEAEPGANLAGAENTMVKHHLSQAGIDRIAGLRELLGDLVQAARLAQGIHRGGHERGQRAVLRVALQRAGRQGQHLERNSGGGSHRYLLPCVVINSVGRRSRSSSVRSIFRWSGCAFCPDMSSGVRRGQRDGRERIQGL